MKPWADVINLEEEETYQKVGFGKPVGMGERPGLIIIDVQYRTVGTKPMPVDEAIKEFPTSCGEYGWAAIRNLSSLLQEFRNRDLPILFAYVAPKESFDAGRLSDKVPSIMTVSERGYDFVDEVSPREGDILLPKRHPSAFFGTPLVSYLVNLGIDTLVVTGATTSGCVRGTVVDAFSYNFRVVVPHDCVYDRAPSPHKANLFDMAYKYADVTTSEEIITLLKSRD